jgi:hypothetical protein
MQHIASVTLAVMLTERRMKREWYGGCVVCEIGPSPGVVVGATTGRVRVRVRVRAAHSVRTPARSHCSGCTCAARQRATAMRMAANVPALFS